MTEEIQRVEDLGGATKEVHRETRLEEMVRERAEGKPLQYVLGEVVEHPELSFELTSVFPSLFRAMLTSLPPCPT